jgi:phospholipid/cholesterol/gamma-HCH transport system substrate-binding protein
VTRQSLNFWVGLFTLLGIAAMLFLALRVGSIGSVRATDTYTVTAVFENIGGLKVRGPVRSAGVRVGRVSGVTLDNETFEAVVTMEIEAQYRFPRDTAARIQTSGLLGEQYIGLLPGGEAEKLGDKGRIEHTQPALVLEQLVNQFLVRAAEGKKD